MQIGKMRTAISLGCHDGLFSTARLLFVGESIHGISEFTQFRLAIAKRYFNQQSILIFEADCRGMQLSHQRGDCARLRLSNFPKVMRTVENLELISWAINNQIPCLGIDCIPRRDLADFSSNTQSQRQREILENERMKGFEDYLAWRARQMAHNLLQIALEYPACRLLIMLHNLHIKRRGSEETKTLSLRSVRQIVEEYLPEKSTSLAQFARGGNGLHNDLTAFNFQINDPMSIESYHTKTNNIVIPSSEIPSGRVGWHHAFERETIPVGKQYEACNLFIDVSPPNIIS